MVVRSVRIGKFSLKLRTIEMKPFGWLCWLFVCAGSTGFSQEVDWLADVQRVPDTPSTFSVGHMEPLLVRADGTNVTTIEAWSARRKELISTWQDFLGPNLTAPSNNEFTILKTERVGEIVRTLIRYECEPGLFVEAYLLRPADESVTRRAGLVALHHTSTATIDETAGISGPESHRLGLKLAQRGFVVICPRCFLWQDAPSLTKAVEAFRERHPNSLGMRKMLFDAQRAVDILIAQPDVDARRIGAIGHSLGAKETLYLAAFDERITAAVASEGGMTFKSTNWDAPWYLGPQIQESSFTRNHHELLAFVAPRAFLILGGESGPGAADGDRSWLLLTAALPVHRLYRKRPRIGLLNHHQGHAIPNEAFDRAAEWLETYLAHSNNRALDN